MEKFDAISFFLGGLIFIIIGFISNDYFMTISFIICGLIFIYGGINNYNFMKNISLKPEKGKKLIQSGKKIIAQIIKVIHLTNTRFNMRAPYMIIAQGINPITNQIQTFKSYYIWDDIAFLIQGKNTIDVYIDPNNPKKYYMDIEKLLYENSNISQQNFIQQNSVEKNFILDSENIILEQDKGELIKQKGIKVIANIKNFKIINDTEINNQNPYIIISEGINPLTNKLQTFQSHFIVGDPNKIKDKKTIDIYIDPDNPSKYYPDIKSVIENPKPNNLDTKIDENSLVFEDGELLKLSNPPKITIPIKKIEKIENLKIENLIFFTIKTDGINPITNQLQNFETKIGILPEKENEIINKLQNYEINIYIDPDNPQKYYMDLEPFITENSINN